MQNGFPYLDILIFGVIAIFLIFRLKNILGTKTDFEESGLNEKKQPKEYSNVVSLKSNINDPVNVEINKIKEVDTNFDLVNFLDGSKTFFEMVLKGFVSGNLDNVKDFMKPSVLKSFKGAIDDRNKEDETLIIDLLSVEKSKIVSSVITKTSIRINVAFETLQITALMDKNEKIIDGDTNKEILVKDEWIFEKKIKDQNPNWTLVETKSL
ncbi:Tim44/TimA family putative adaptor protein [Alphaproteobacteria bacterium]|nr:Tim44/TimA family putative adaptor protein [Alphaproteobacteria bacterium]